MKSELHVKSSINNGSVFWFDVDLPQVKSTMVGPPKPILPIIGIKGKKRQALIVDDDPDNRNVLKTILTLLGFDIREASHGVEALQKTENEPPDLILMDLVMPELDGFETTRRLRQRASGDDSVIIALSANAFEHTRLRSLAAGCDDFLSKPIDITELLTRLETHLHVEWIYGQENEAGLVMELGRQDRQTDETPGESCIAPPLEQLAALLELVRKGDIISIPAQAERLEQFDPQYGLFVRRIQQFAKTFQIDRLERFITQYLPEEHMQTTQEAKEKSHA
jgi:CheY-like chemotaxis protein